MPERRCGTCENYARNHKSSSYGGCCWEPAGPMPLWLKRIAPEVHQDDGPDCPTWLAKDGRDAQSLV